MRSRQGERGNYRDLFLHPFEMNFGLKKMRFNINDNTKNGFLILASPFSL